jgi:HEAT repeat protein
MGTALAVAAGLWLACALAWGQAAPAATVAQAGQPEEVRQLCAALRDGSPQARAQACQRLAVIGSPEAVPALAALLGDPKLAAYGRLALEAIPGPAVGEALRAALGTLQGNLLVGVINSLGVRRDGQAVPELGRRLAAEDGAVADAAAAALGRIANREAGQALTAAFDVAAQARRPALGDACLACAGRWLAQGDREPAEVLYERVRQADVSRHQRVAATRGVILARQAAGLPVLVELLRSDDPALLGLALALARELPDPQVVPTLSTALPTLPPAVQVSLLEALADRGEASVAAAVRVAAGSTAVPVRVAALKALGRVGDASCTDLLLAGLAPDRSPEETAAALSSLRRIKGPAVDAALVAALPVGPPALRVALIRVLAERDARSSVGALLEQAAAQDAKVSEAAFAALAAVGRAEDLPRLARLLLACRHDSARDAAVRAVGALAQQVPDVAHRADSLLALWPEAQDSASRCLLIRALGSIGNHAAFAALRGALSGDDAQARDTALRAFASWPDATPASLLLDFASAAKEPVPRALALRAGLRLAGMVSGDCETPSRQVVEWFAQAATAAQTPDDKKLLLAGLAALQHPSALPLAQAHLDDAEVQTEAGLAVVQIAATLTAMGQREAAKAALARVVARVKDPALQERAKVAAQALDAPAEYVLDWQICGPYTEEGKECQQLYPVVFEPEKPGASPDWRLLAAGSAQGGNLVRVDPVLAGNHRVAYVRTWLISAREQPARFELGFDDGGKVWLNDAVVCEANTAGACVPGAHKAEVALRQGPNQLLLKLTQHSGPWHFCLRLVGPDGKPLPDVQVSAVPSGEAPPMAGPPALPVADNAGALEQAVAVPIFDGKSLAGWEGDAACFRLEDAAIVGGQLGQPIARSAYLCTTQPVGDFELTVQVRTLGNGTNGGIQFWGKRIPDSHEMSGLQADVCDGAYWGCLYDCTRGRMLVAVPQRDLNHIVRRADWNEYRIRAAGDRIQLWLNGYRTVDWVETDPNIARQGIFGLQTHQGPPGEGWYRELRLKAAK